MEAHMDIAAEQRWVAERGGEAWMGLDQETLLDMIRRWDPFQREEGRARMAHRARVWPVWPLLSSEGV